MRMKLSVLKGLSLGALLAAAVIGVLIRFALTRYRASGLYDSREPPIIEPPSLEPTGREPPSRVAPFR